MNQRTEEQKVLFLTASLKGMALIVLSNLSEKRQKELSSFIRTLTRLFIVGHKARLVRVKFKNSIRKSG